MQKRTLGQSLEVSAIGLGCMRINFHRGEAMETKDAIALLRGAFERGVTFFDTAEAYGPFSNEEIVGEALAPVRDRVVIATKFGFTIGDQGIGFQRATGLDGSPANARRVAEASLKRLGVETIDLFYLHRPDPAVPIEESVGGMAELVREGKILAMGLSEVTADQLRRAHATHPIAALQSEYSLFTRDVETEILPTCRELGIGLVAYSPLGRGFLAGEITKLEDLAPDDSRRAGRFPRFEGENFDRNKALAAEVKTIAEEKGCTPAQLALAWVLARGDDVVPIPGTRRRRHLEDNIGALEVQLSKEDLDRLESVIPPEAVAGQRYAAPGMAGVNL